MNILVVMPHFYPATVYGGPIISSYNTCIELASLGHNVLVSTTNVNKDNKLEVETKTCIEISKNFNVKYYNETIMNRFSFSMAVNLWEDIKSVDIVYIQYLFNYSTLVALLYATLMNKKIILSPRGCLGAWCLAQGSKIKPLWNKIFIRPIAGKIKWHATSEQEKREIQEQFGNVPIFISPNGIDLQEFQGAVKLSNREVIEKYCPEYRCDTYNKLIISLGRLQKKKGYDILIKSFSQVLHQFPDSLLIIAGPDEGEKENLNKLIADIGLSNNAYIIDSVYGQDKLNFLASADVFAMPSYNENFGNVYLESLAAGTPIVASTHTPWQIVEGFRCGKWVSVDINEVASAISALLASERNSLRDRALLCATEFSWAKTARLISDNFK